MQEGDEPEIAMVVVETQYLCGAHIGFVARSTEAAAIKAAKIMTDVCPECKQAMGEELSQDDKDVLSISPKAHAKAKEN